MPRALSTSMATGLLVLLVVLLGARPGDGGDPPREHLLGNLLRAKTDDQVDAALDALAQQGGFADMGAFGDFLGRVAEPKASHPHVLLRRGWAYVAVGRGRDALGPLSLARESAPIEAMAVAYLGEASRQASQPAKALALLVEAAKLGYEEGTFLDDAALKAGFELRQKVSARDAERLPAYAEAVEPYLAVRPSATFHAALARWLLDDHVAYGGKGTTRDLAWSTAAARHLLAALSRDASIPDGLRLAVDAGRALRWDREVGGTSPLLFDCLAWAYRLGTGPNGDTHGAPQAVAWLADAALEEGRFRLAARLARQRLTLSDSPLAREILRRLPLDLGD